MWKIAESNSTKQQICSISDIMVQDTGHGGGGGKCTERGDFKGTVDKMSWWCYGDIFFVQFTAMPINVSSMRKANLFGLVTENFKTF